MREATKKGALGIPAFIQERSRGPWDVGGPLDGFGLSPADVALYAARMTAIQNQEHARPKANPSKLIIGGK